MRTAYLFRLKPKAQTTLLACSVGCLLLASIAHALTISLATEVEQGQLSGAAGCMHDDSASSSAAIVFGDTTSCNAPYIDAGAHLPIQYNLGSLTGTVRYVSTTGNDTTGDGSINMPYASIAKAATSANSGDSIVIRGGTYRQGNITLASTKTLTITAYPGEIPIFNGAQIVTGPWTSEGGLSYISYTAQPVTDGSGISFTTGQNLLGDGVGKYPDQAWIGSNELRQVIDKASVSDSKFWVDSANGRLYITETDAAKPDIEVSQLDKFMLINAPSTSVRGLVVTRYSNSANDYGVILVNATADNTTLDNLSLSDSAFQLLSVSGSSNLLTGVTAQHITLTNGNWMGINALYTDDFTLSDAYITGMNPFAEFDQSPQSGALKTSRTRRTTVQNSYIADNKSNGIWFDQSNYDVRIAGNRLKNNAIDPVNGSTANLFYEISDKVLIVNNYFEQVGQNVNIKLAGSSGLSLVNNTIVGGVPLGIFTDNRSFAGCADPAQSVCTNSYASDRDTVRSYIDTIDWMPRLDLSLNNIVAYSTSTRYCTNHAAICVSETNQTAYRPLETILHQADVARGIPQTQMDGDVIANGSYKLFNSGAGNYSTLSSFTTAMAGSPVLIAGLEANGLSGNSYVNPDGSPTGALSAVHNQAQPVPTDATLNTYIPAGTRHFGVTYK